MLHGPTISGLVWREINVLIPPAGAVPLFYIFERRCSSMLALSRTKTCDCDPSNCATRSRSIWKIYRTPDQGAPLTIKKPGFDRFDHLEQPASWGTPWFFLRFLTRISGVSSFCSPCKKRGGGSRSHPSSTAVPAAGYAGAKNGFSGKIDGSRWTYGPCFCFFKCGSRCFRIVLLLKWLQCLDRLVQGVWKCFSWWGNCWFLMGVVFGLGVWRFCFFLRLLVLDSQSCFFEVWGTWGKRCKDLVFFWTRKPSPGFLLARCFAGRVLTAWRWLGKSCASTELLLLRRRMGKSSGLLGGDR